MAINSKSANPNTDAITTPRRSARNKLKFPSNSTKPDPKPAVKEQKSVSETVYMTSYHHHAM